MKPRARTLGELKAIGYEVLPIKEEMRRNLIEKLRRRERLFPGIIGKSSTPSWQSTT
jgi:magnesium chelatase subunit I